MLVKLILEFAVVLGAIFLGSRSGGVGLGLWGGAGVLVLSYGFGLPPTGGTWSKFYLALGSLEAGQIWMLAVLMVSSVLNIAYLLPIPVRAFLANPPGNAPNGVKEAPLPCLIAIGVTSLGCLALFFYPDLLYQLARLVGAGG